MELIARAPGRAAGADIAEMPLSVRIAVHLCAPGSKREETRPSIRPRSLFLFLLPLLPLRVPRVLPRTQFRIPNEYMKGQNKLLIPGTRRRRSRDFQVGLDVARSAIAFRRFPIFVETSFRRPEIPHQRVFAPNVLIEGEALGDVSRRGGDFLPSRLDRFSICAKELGPDLVE